MQRQGIPLIARLVIDLARYASARCPRWPATSRFSSVAGLSPPTIPPPLPRFAARRRSVAV